MSLVHSETGELVALCTPEEARIITDRIKVAVEAAWELIVQAYQARAWAALGYSSWDDYCTREFGTARIRLPREERPEVVASLRDAGLSIRAIQAATGISQPTVIKDLRQNEVLNSLAPENGSEVTGTDGKTYPVRQPAPRPKKPDTLRAVAVALHKLDVAAEAFEAVDLRRLSDYADEAPVWVGNLAESMKAVHAFENKLKEIST